MLFRLSGRFFIYLCKQCLCSTTHPKINIATGLRNPAGPRRLGTTTRIMRIAVPQALCVLLEYTGSSPKSGKVCRSDTRPGDVCERAERSEGSDTTPTQNATCFAVCALVCDLSPKAECVPAFTRESERGPFVREAEKCDEMRFGTAL